MRRSNMLNARAQPVKMILLARTGIAGHLLDRAGTGLRRHHGSRSPSWSDSMTLRTFLGRILSRPRIIRGTGPARRPGSGTRRWNLQHLEDLATPALNVGTRGNGRW